jgi:hypothetical protein
LAPSSFPCIALLANCHSEATYNLSDLVSELVKILKLVFAQVSSVQSDIKLRPDFSTRTFGDHEKLMKF